jgi:hypothetical protein
MANQIKLKNSAVAAKQPLLTDLVYGEVALNYADGKIYYKRSDNTIQSISGGGGASAAWTKITTATTATTGQQLLTTSTVGTLTLPATPTMGDSVVVMDGNNWSTTNLTIARNGSTIEGIAEDLVCDIGGTFITLVYDGTTWQVAANIGPQGPQGLGGSGVIDRKSYTSTSGQTVFAINYVAPYVDVFLNGVRLSSSDYTATSGTSITMSVGTVVGDEVELQGFGTTTTATDSLSPFLLMGA